MKTTLHPSSAQKPTEVARLLEFGARGHAIAYSNPPYRNCHLSGYDSPDKFGPLEHWWAHGPEEMISPWGSLTVPADGIPCLDKREAVKTEAGYSWVFRGPMCDPDLPDGEVDACPMPDPMFAAAVADNAYGSLLVEHVASRAQKRARSGLDSVSVAEYVQGWREHGAKVGRAFREADGSARIVWEVTP